MLLPDNPKCDRPEPFRDEGLNAARYISAPIPMTLEDWSEAKKIIDKLVHDGVTDIVEYVRDHPEILRKLAPGAVIKDVNPAAVEIYKARDREHLLAAFNEPPDLSTYNPETGLSDIFVSLLARFANGENRVVLEGPDTALDGSRLYIRTTTSITQGYEEDWSDVIQTVEDFTSRYEAEIALQIARNQAEYANTVKSQFLANMSHEFRTPLNAIMGFTQMMMDEVFGPVGNKKYTEYLSDVNACSAHLLGLVDDILDISKIEAGELDLHEEPFELVNLLQSSIKLVDARGGSPAAGILFEVKGAMPALYADYHMVKQIILNLLSNAVKFTPPDGRVVLSADSDEKMGLVVRVADTGCGIATEDIERALQPFVQVGNDVAISREGTGLGLALSVKLMELHGGTLDLKSTINVGTTVTVTFPAERLVKA
jgi:signal transduction histidine kinase